MRGYLVLRPTTKGRGGGGELSRPPHDYKNGKLYNRQFLQIIRTIYEKYKTSRADDLSLVRFTWQLIYVRVFSVKLTENDHKF